MISISIVFAAEIFNTSLEQLYNQIETNQNEQIGKIKDLAVAGVLITAIAALVVGLIIFLPKMVG